MYAARVSAAWIPDHWLPRTTQARSANSPSWTNYRTCFLPRMWIETARVGFIAVGGLVALVLFAGPRLACRFYAAALVKGRDRTAGFWAALAAGGGSRAVAHSGGTHGQKDCADSSSR